MLAHGEVICDPLEILDAYLAVRNVELVEAVVLQNLAQGVQRVFVVEVLERNLEDVEVESLVQGICEHEFQMLMAIEHLQVDDSEFLQIAWSCQFQVVVQQLEGFGADGMVFQHDASHRFLSVKNLENPSHLLIGERLVVQIYSNDFKLPHFLPLAFLEDINEGRENFIAEMHVFNLNLVFLNNFKNLRAGPQSLLLAEFEELRVKFIFALKFLVRATVHHFLRALVEPVLV